MTISSSSATMRWTFSSGSLLSTLMVFSRAAFSVMPGLVPGIHVFLDQRRSKSWMAGTSPAMTNSLFQRLQRVVLGFGPAAAAVIVQRECSSAERGAVRLDHGLAELLELVGELLFGLADLFGRLGGGFAQNLLEHFLVGVGQFRPHMASHDREQRLGDVPGQDDVRLHLVELLRHDGRQRILLPVHRAL